MLLKLMKKVYGIMVVNVVAMLILQPVVYASITYNLGRFGKTYEIVEKDALTEIEERAKAVDWGKVFDSAREKLKNFQPPDIARLSDAKEDRVFYVDMSYTLPYDIRDHDNNLLYPKGYTFNPLDYITYPNILVFINGSRDDHIKWFMESEYVNDHRVMLLLSDGSYYEVMRKLKRPVFYLTKQIKDRFHLQAVPSIVKQSGKKMEVKEVALKKRRKETKK